MRLCYDLTPEELTDGRLADLANPSHPFKPYQNPIEIGSLVRHKTLGIVGIVVESYKWMVRVNVGGHVYQHAPEKWNYVK